MLKDEKISPRQFSLLVIMFTIGSSIIIAPSALVINSKQDGWIAGILALLIGLLLVWLYSALANRYPGHNLPDIIEKSMGRAVGKFLIILYFFFSLTLAALVLRNLGDFLTTKIMVETPLEALHFMFLIPVIYAAKLGIETYTRVAEVTFPFVILLLILLFALTTPQIELTNIQPVFGESFKSIFLGSLSMLGVPFLEMVLLMTFFSSINKPEKMKKFFMIGVGFGGFVLILTTVYTILVLGIELTSIKLFPAYVLAKKISLADFLERVEVIIAAVWGITLYFKLLLSFHSSVIMLDRAFNLNNYRILVFPITLLVYIYSLVAYPNSAYFIQFATETWLSFALLFGLVLPLLMLLLSYVKKDEARA